MVHFSIESLGHGGGGFLDTITSSLNVTGLTGAGTITSTPKTQSFVETSTQFQTNQLNLQNILAGFSLPKTSTQALTDFNLVKLGEASVEISGALTQQINIREQQRAETFGVINVLADFIGGIDKRLSGQISELGTTVQTQNAGDPLGDTISFFQDNPFFGGLGSGALLAGAAILGILILK